MNGSSNTAALSKDRGEQRAITQQDESFSGRRLQLRAYFDGYRERSDDGEFILSVGYDSEKLRGLQFGRSREKFRLDRDHFGELQTIQS